ncbi:MAG: nicotinate-nucleotide adenylyltransferase [Bacteroidaceae bacterium]|nr:nicotinate-nucleotide adenylyltransferase [Bacteroidaceae bacterium]
MSRIAIFGGSFNPIHIGHISIAKAVMQSGLADKVWLMVSPRNPLKQAEDLMPDEERLDRVRQAVKELDGIEACDFEFHMPKPSYTYLTLRRMRKAYPEDQFTLVIGADNWQRFSLWRHHRELINHYPIIIYPRRGYDIDTATLPSTAQYLDMPLCDVSSTQIRQALARGEDVSSLIP